MEKDDELYEVGVGLLPERFFALTKEVVQQRRDAVGKSVGIQVVVQRIVTVVRFEDDLDVVFTACVRLEDPLHFTAEVAFYFEHKAADLPLAIGRPKSEDLFGEWEDAAGGLAGSDRAEDGNAGEQAPLGNGEPPRRRGRARSPGIVNLADDQEEIFAQARIGIGGQMAWPGLLRDLEDEDADSRERNRVDGVRGRIEENGLGILQSEKHGPRPEKNEFKEEVLLRERHLHVEHESRRRGQQTSHEVS